MKIKIWIPFGVIFLFCIGYGYLIFSSHPSIMMDNLRAHFSEVSEKQHNEMQLKGYRICEFYKRADSNLLDGVAYIDSLLEFDKMIAKNEQSHLQRIVGETLYDNDSIQLALSRFEMSDSILGVYPRNQCNKAGCFAKMGDYKTAMKLLIAASKQNYSNKWYIGNLYEVMNQKELAIKEYKELYEKCQDTYYYCEERITELKKEDSQLLTELIYRERRERAYLLFKPSNPNSKGLEIGEIDFIIKGNSL